MRDVFKEATKSVMNQARREAQRMDLGYMGPEHLLMGLLREPACYGACLLQKLGPDSAVLRADIESRVGAEKPISLQLPFTESAKGVLEHSMQEAADLGHDYVGTQHLLLGLFKPGASHIAGDALAHFGITALAIREIVRAHPGLDEDAGPVTL